MAGKRNYPLLRVFMHPIIYLEILVIMLSPLPIRNESSWPPVYWTAYTIDYSDSVSVN